MAMNTSDFIADNIKSSKLADSPDGGFLSFGNSNDNSSSNRQRKNSKFNSPCQTNEQFCPQGFSSPLHNNRNYNRNWNQSGNSYGERSRGNQNHNRGNFNWKHRGDNRKPYHNHQNRSFNKNDSATVDISSYFHPSMVEDPWRHFKLNSSSNINDAIDLLSESKDVSNTQQGDNNESSISQSCS